MKTSLILSAAFLPVIALTACDSKAERARKDALESKADTLDAEAKATRDVSKKEAENAKKQNVARAEDLKEGAKAQAQAEKQSGEQRAEALEQKAKETRDQK